MIPLGEIEAARDRIAGAAVRTPLVQLPDTAHHSFTDFVWLVPQLGADPVEAEVGTVDAAQTVREQNALLRRFFDVYSRG